MKVGIIGLGRVGLPLALVFASRGIQVIGLDIDKLRHRASCLLRGYNESDARARERYLKSSMGKRYLRNRLKRFLSLTG